VANLTASQKQELKILISRVNFAYSDPAFAELLRHFLVLKNIVPFIELENWLKELIAEKIYLCHGILSWLYYTVQDYENSANQAVEAEKHFPDTEIWDNLAKNALTDEAIEWQLLTGE
jgi:hypothetical protein